VLRRGRPADAKEKKASLKAGDLEIDRYRFEVRMKGRQVELTPKEFELLATLVGTPGRVFGREELLDRSGAATASWSPGRWTSTWRACGASSRPRSSRSPASRPCEASGYRFKDRP